MGDFTVGSLFTGYGGLDMAIGGSLSWVSEIDTSACAVLGAHYPDVPNLGDVKAIDWSTVPKVDILTGGYPCQPFSSAGLRKGQNDERHLWPHVREAISALRPRLVVLENVRGHVSLGLREVLGEIAELGYGARWGVVRASDAGAPHQRARVFVVAYPEGYECDERLDGFGSSHGGKTGVQVSAGRSDQFAVEWGGHARAIERWETITRRPAPAPTAVSNGQERLNPVFAEWMMGLPLGWVTGRGLPASKELKLLGNGVVPQQARLALSLLAAGAADHTLVF